MDKNISNNVSNNISDKSSKNVSNNISNKISKATADDYYEIARIYVNNYKTVYKDFVSLEYMRSLNHIDKSQEIKLMMNYTDYYVLKNDYNIVGYLNIESGYRKKEINSLYVDINYHKQGYGTLLFNYAYSLLEGYEEKFTGWIIKGYSPALNFYLKQDSFLTGKERFDNKLNCQMQELSLKIK